MVLLDLTVILEDPFDDTALDALSLYEMMDHVHAVRNDLPGILGSGQGCLSCWTTLTIMLDFQFLVLRCCECTNLETEESQGYLVSVSACTLQLRYPRLMT